MKTYIFGKHKHLRVAGGEREQRQQLAQRGDAVRLAAF